jgi:hypothetical protein
MAEEDALQVSEVISDRLQGLINDVLAEQFGGGFLSGFVGIIKYIDGDGDNNWSFVAMGNQSLDASLGMLHIAERITDKQMAEVWGL